MKVKEFLENVKIDIVEDDVYFNVLTYNGTIEEYFLNEPHGDLLFAEALDANMDWFVKNFFKKELEPMYPKVERLFLNNKGLYELPEWIYQFPNISWLELMYNNFFLLPEELAKFTKLKWVYFSNQKHSHSKNLAQDLSIKLPDCIVYF